MTVLSQSFVTLVSSAAFRISIIRSKNVFCVFSLPYCHTLMVNYLAQFIRRVSQSCYIILTCDEKLGTIWFWENSIKGGHSYRCTVYLLKALSYSNCLKQTHSLFLYQLHDFSKYMQINRYGMLMRKEYDIIKNCKPSSLIRHLLTMRRMKILFSRENANTL